jgi:hypothetical protein
MNKRSCKPEQEEEQQREQQSCVTGASPDAIVRFNALRDFEVAQSLTVGAHPIHIVQILPAGPGYLNGVEIVDQTKTENEKKRWSQN